MRHTCWTFYCYNSWNSILGSIERFVGVLHIYQLLLLFRPPLYICFQNHELPCCIRGPPPAWSVNQHQCKAGIIILPDPPCKSTHTCSLPEYIHTYIHTCVCVWRAQVWVGLHGGSGKIMMPTLHWCWLTMLRKQIILICIYMCLYACGCVCTILPAFWMNCDLTGCFIPLWQFH